MTENQRHQTSVVSAVVSYTTFYVRVCVRKGDRITAFFCASINFYFILSLVETLRE